MVGRAPARIISIEKEADVLVTFILSEINNKLSGCSSAFQGI
jgi:hypothetical protein